MPNELIVEALKSSLARGESLKRAMMTLYNAGYIKEEIMEAARSIQEFAHTPQQQTQKPKTPQKKIRKRKIKKAKKPIKQEPRQPGDLTMLAPPKKLIKRKQTASQRIQPSLKQVQQPPQKLPMQQQMPQQQIPQQQAQQQVQPQQQIQQPQPQQKVSPQKAQPQQMQQAPQRVSAYGQPPKPAGKAVIIILGFLLLLLIGILVTIFLFKEELIDYFNNLFS